MAFVGWSMLFALIAALYLVLENLRRGAVAAFLRARPDTWVTTGDLARVFGGGVYVTLRQLHEEGMLEREEAGTPERVAARLGSPVVSYRWRHG
jgi:hypothetical protein